LCPLFYGNCIFRINDELVHKEDKNWNQDGWYRVVALCNDGRMYLHGFGSALFFPDDFELSVKSKLERLGEANG
jgi:hypothetical protein